MARRKHYWLFKSEPDVFSIDDLAREDETYWEGVRNYQARNMLRDDIKKGDGILYYHSRVQPIGVAGIAEVRRSGYPDPDQFDAKAKYHDAKSDPDNPRWFCVDVGFVKKFDTVVTLAALKEDPKLEGMMVTQRGSRLSIQPVEKAHFDYIVRLSKKS